MPRLGRIIDVAEELKSSSLVLHAQRCTHRHHRASSCSCCEQVCPTQAITVSAEGPSFDTLTCEGCGACASVCPTGAIEPLDPTDPVLADRIATRTASDEHIAIACAQARSSGSGALRVSCLARLDPSLPMYAMAKGAASVSLYSGVCGECPTKGVDAHVSSIVAGTRKLLEAFHLPGNIDLGEGQEHPGPEAEAEAEPEAEPEKPAGMTRRGLFQMFRRGGAVYAAKTMEGILVEPETPASEEKPRRDDPAYVPAKRERLLESLRALVPKGSAPRDAVGPFTAPEIDRDRCNGCGLCGRLCPTGALEIEEDGDDKQGVLRITGRPSACVECGLCVEICGQQAVKLVPVVTDLVLASDARAQMLFERAEGDAEPLYATAEDKMKKLLGVPVHRL